MSLAKPGVVTLSKGSVWAKEYRAFEYHQNAWPSFATAYIKFFNTRGAELTTIAAVEVTAEGIKFLAQPEEIEMVPSGAKYETFVDTEDGPMAISYGTVMRREATFFDAPAAELREEARGFADSFQRARLGDRWEAVRGGTKIYNNAAASLANGIGANTGLFANQPSALRYYKQLASNTVEIGVTLVKPPNSGGGKQAVALCADMRFTSGLAVQWDTANVIRFGRITSPQSIVQLGQPIANTVVSNDFHRIVYNDLTDKLLIYKGTSESPMGEWVDVDGVIPHGNGFCHTGFIFNPGTTLVFGSTGPQFSGWTAKDTV